jgi:hypothetical protein
VYAASPAVSITSGDFTAPSESVLGADFALNAVNGTYQDTGLSVALPAAGTYLVHFHVRGEVQFSAGTLGFISAKLYNSTDSADVANSETLVVTQYTTGLTGQATASASKIVTVTAAKTIKLYAKRDSATTWTTSQIRSTVDGRTRMSYVRLA